MPEITRTAAEVAAMLEDGREIAFLDVREIVPFGTGHPCSRPIWLSGKSSAR